MRHPCNRHRFLLVVLDENLTPLTGISRQNLKNLVIKQLIERCNETLHSVQDIPRMYRKTNREVKFIFDQIPPIPIFRLQVNLPIVFQHPFVIFKRSFTITKEQF